MPVRSPTAPTRPVADPLAQLPHGAAFRFVSEVVSLVGGETVTAIWRINGSEPFLAAHFPGEPIVPGVLLTEALAQAAGLIVGEQSGALLCHIDVRLHEPVRPPAVVSLEATLTRELNGLYLFDVAAGVNGTTVASGRLTLAARKEATDEDGSR